MSVMSTREVEAARLLGQVVSSVQEGQPRPSRLSEVPGTFDPTSIPPLRYAKGLTIDEFDGRLCVVLDFEYPDASSPSVRLLPSGPANSREECIEVARAVLCVVAEAQRAAAAAETAGRKVFELGGVRLPFDDATIATARRTMKREAGIVATLDDIRRFFDSFLEAHRTVPEIRLGLDRSPTAICFAAVAAGMGLRAWPVKDGESPYLH